MSTESGRTNRLSRESSPYLLQHQFNPVDWYAWGQEAFEAARAQDRPIFLSVGYSTCYWCHVMERESFESEEVAGEMNKRFICIKVDREERPDVDQLYMTAVQVLTRHGGWPMSVFLTPELKPFFGGTYFPSSDMPGRMGFVTLLQAIDDAWRHRRDQVQASAEQLSGVLAEISRPPAPQSSFVIDGAFVDRVIERSTDDFDSKHGGYGSAPKFPRQTLLELLLAYVDRLDTGRDEKKIANTREQIIRSLDAMADGGIRDHLGGGFHRYSTDAQWVIPHFEIMLYDNAMLGWLYVEAYRQFHEERHAAVARGVLDFLLRDMMSPEGVFYTAFDAEAEGREGRPYLWTKEQVREVLAAGGGDEQGVESRKFEARAIALFFKMYGLEGRGNFTDPHHPADETGQYVLHLPRPLAVAAKEEGMSVEELEVLLQPMRQKLLAHRRRRVQPMLDTKILTSWNAMAIVALAHGGRVLGEKRYVQAAGRAAAWLMNHHLGADGSLIHATRPEHPGRQAPGFLDDYAGMVGALLELEEMGEGSIANLGQVIAKLGDEMMSRFGAEGGGFYFTDRGADELIVRQMIGTDSPTPSGNALAAAALMKRGRDSEAGSVLRVFGESLRRQGEGMSALAGVALRWVRRHGSLQVGGGDPAHRPDAGGDGTHAVDLSARWISETILEARLNIAQGYHLNAHDAGEGLIATTLRVGRPHEAAVAGIDYPPGAMAGQAIIAVRFATRPERRGEPVRLTLSYQPCTDRACLAPAVARVSIGWA